MSIWNLAKGGKPTKNICEAIFRCLSNFYLSFISKLNRFHGQSSHRETLAIVLFGREYIFVNQTEKRQRHTYARRGIVRRSCKLLILTICKTSSSRSNWFFFSSFSKSFAIQFPSFVIKLLLLPVIARWLDLDCHWMIVKCSFPMSVSSFTRLLPSNLTRGWNLPSTSMYTEHAMSSNWRKKWQFLK